jgi:hypothetical protein
MKKNLEPKDFFPPNKKNVGNIHFKQYDAAARGAILQACQEPAIFDGLKNLTKGKVVVRFRGVGVGGTPTSVQRYSTPGKICRLDRNDILRKEKVEFLWNYNPQKIVGNSKQELSDGISAIAKWDRSDKNKAIYAATYPKKETAVSQIVSESALVGGRSKTIYKDRLSAIKILPRIGEEAESSSAPSKSAGSFAGGDIARTAEEEALMISRAIAASITGPQSSGDRSDAIFRAGLQRALEGASVDPPAPDFRGKGKGRA